MVGNLTDSPQRPTNRNSAPTNRNSAPTGIQNLSNFLRSVGLSRKPNKNALNYEQKRLLSDLLAIRAATPLQFELETNRIGQKNIANDLEELEQLGFVKADRRDSVDYPEIVVFYPSWKTRWRRIFGRL